MIWLTWRQHRNEALAGGLVLALLGAYLLFTGSQMYNAAARWGLFSCHGDVNLPQACGVAIYEFDQRFLNLIVTKYALMVLPALLGVFVGAPLLAREVDQGTHVVVWTQSITRMHWFTVKIVLLSGVTLVSAGALAGLVTWWHRPLDLVFSSGPWTFFDAAGPVPVAYALFAFALGVSAGTFIPRTVPAMGTTLLLFTAARVAMSLLRPWYLAPLIKETPFGQASFPTDALPVDLYWVDQTNSRVSFDRIEQLIHRAFPGLIGSFGSNGPTPMSGTDVATIGQYLHDLGFRYLAVYQPIERFWTFQVIEANFFLLIALGLLGISAWWLRHRVR